MYLYDEIDQRLVDQRVSQFRDQTRRFLANKLSEEEFRALRLRNGLYIQRYAPMLRIAIPYGLLSSKQLRKLSAIATRPSSCIAPVVSDRSSARRRFRTWDIATWRQWPVASVAGKL